MPFAWRPREAFWGCAKGSVYRWSWVGSKVLLIKITLACWYHMAAMLGRNAEEITGSKWIVCELRVGEKSSETSSCGIA
jgi:hypothetical protein